MYSKDVSMDYFQEHTRATLELYGIRLNGAHYEMELTPLPWAVSITPIYSRVQFTMYYAYCISSSRLREAFLDEELGLWLEQV